MLLKFIENGTRMDIQVAADSSRDFGEDTVLGTFIGLEAGVVSFSIECDALLNSEQGLEAGNFLRFTFFRGASMYTFEGVVTEVSPPYNTKRILVDATTLIEISNRRKSHRVEVSVPVNVYREPPDEQSKEEPVMYRGMTMDISDAGLCILSNEKLDLRDGPDFRAEFTLNRSEKFDMPVRHIRTGNSPQFVQYQYDHAFLFDRETDAEKINKMTISLFQHVLRSRF